MIISYQSNQRHTHTHPDLFHLLCLLLTIFNVTKNLNALQYQKWYISIQKITRGLSNCFLYGDLILTWFFLGYRHKQKHKMSYNYNILTCKLRISSLMPIFFYFYLFISISNIITLTCTYGFRWNLNLEIYIPMHALYCSYWKANSQ